MHYLIFRELLVSNLYIHIHTHIYIYIYIYNSTVKIMKRRNLNLKRFSLKHKKLPLITKLLKLVYVWGQ